MVPSTRGHWIVREEIEAANALGLSRTLPSHYDTWRGRVDLGEPGIVAPRTLR